jgi:hypothetical protein
MEFNLWSKNGGYKFNDQHGVLVASTALRFPDCLFSNINIAFTAILAGGKSKFPEII